MLKNNVEVRRESIARTIAENLGLVVKKNRSKDQNSPEYKCFSLSTKTGNCIVSGSSQPSFLLSLSDLENELKQYQKRPSARPTGSTSLNGLNQQPTET